MYKWNIKAVFPALALPSNSWLSENSLKQSSPSIHTGDWVRGGWGFFLTEHGIYIWIYSPTLLLQNTTIICWPRIIYSDKKHNLAILIVQSCDQSIMYLKFKCIDVLRNVCMDNLYSYSFIDNMLSSSSFMNTLLIIIQTIVSFVHKGLLLVFN